MRIRASIIIVIIFCGNISLQAQQTLPTWHWSYSVIERLQDEGHFQSLSLLASPYTHEQVAMVLSRSSGALKNNAELRPLYLRLVNEFIKKPGIQYPADGQRPVELGGHAQAGFRETPGDNAAYRGMYRCRIAVPLGTHVMVYNGINFDQNLNDDPRYVGKEWRGIAGYTEQAYIAGRWGRYHVKYGRDFLKWGVGSSGTLVFTNVSRPMDLFNAGVKVGPFHYQYLTARLDDETVSKSVARRYLSSHRLEGCFFNGRIQAAVSETIIYGGVNRNPEWVYLNPFVFYHGAQLNESGLGNTLGTVDISVYITDTWRVYGSLLIDDVQIEKTGPGDLEPNEIGWILGSRYAGLWSGAVLDLEYARVTNRTYKTTNTWESFLHRNFPLGHPLGNDFDHWQIGLAQWVGASLWGRVAYSQTRHGEGSLYTSWDQPWMDYTVKEGYSEPFPTGVVETQNSIKLELKYQPSIHWGIEGFFQSISRDNAFNVKGTSQSDTAWRIGFWWDGDLQIRL